VLLVALGITGSVYMEFEIPTYLKRSAAGGWPEFWQAVDVMLLVPLLWLPVVADYARRSVGTGSAFAGSFLGLAVTTAWIGALGMVYLPAVESGDIAGFVVGMELGMAGLVILLLLQTDEVFVNTYSAGEAANSVLPVGSRTAAFGCGALALILALAFDLLSAEGSLLLLASLFVPLAGVVIADFILTRGEEGLSIPSSAGVAWAVGFLVYHWIAPSDAAWWQDVTRWLFDDTLRLPYPLTDEVAWLGAAVPSFLVGFAIHAALRSVLAFMRQQPLTTPAN
jgi:purine-cytosine permease-like protein